MDLESLQRLARRNANLMLWAETADHPDVGEVRPRGPLDLVVHAQGQALTAYAWSHQVHRVLDPGMQSALVERMEAALAEGDIDQPVDTAVSRRITHVTLRAAWRLQGPALATFTRSEFQRTGSLDRPGWASLLTMLADLTTADAPESVVGGWHDLLCAFALGATAPLLTTPWVVPVVPGQAVWGAVLGEAGMYLRLGQPPGPSRLYRVVLRGDAALVWAVSEGGGSEVLEATLVPATYDGVARWRTTLDAGYRSDGRGDVELIVGNRAVTVRAPGTGPGVFVQRG